MRVSVGRASTTRVRARLHEAAEVLEAHVLVDAGGREHVVLQHRALKHRLAVRTHDLRARR